MRSIICALLVAASALAGCATYTEDLNRGQKHFQASEYERALATFRVLESDFDSLSPMDRARYAYLRGMTDYRLNFREDARYWLAIARAIENKSPGALQVSWRERMREALANLDGNVSDGSQAIGEATMPMPYAPAGL